MSNEKKFKYDDIDKIHLADSTKLAPACKTRPRWTPYVFASKIEDITCKLCLKWIEAHKRSLELNQKNAKMH